MYFVPSVPDVIIMVRFDSVAVARQICEHHYNGVLATPTRWGPGVHVLIGHKLWATTKKVLAHHKAVIILFIYQSA